MVLSAKLRNRKLATPCTNYGTVGENMESGVLFVAYYEKTKGKIAAAVGKIPYLSVEGIKEKNTAIVRLFRLAWCCRE